MKSGCKVAVFKGFVEIGPGRVWDLVETSGGFLDELGISVRMEAAGSLRHGCDRRFFGND